MYAIYSRDWGTENTYEPFYTGDKNNSTITRKDNWYVSSHLLNVITSGRQGTETKWYLNHKCVCTRRSISWWGKPQPYFNRILHIVQNIYSLWKCTQPTTRTMVQYVLCHPKHSTITRKRQSQYICRFGLTDVCCTLSWWMMDWNIHNDDLHLC